jgi:cytochrome c553
MRRRIAILLSLTAALPLGCNALAGDGRTDKASAVTVCAACHGANGVSVAEHIPNLAGQKSDYLTTQLAAFKEGSRKSELMNPIAAQLSETDIASAVAYFSTQDGASSKVKSALQPNFANTNVSFPPDYKTGFTRYHTLDDADNMQVKHYYANGIAVHAVSIGKPLPNGAMIVVEIYAVKLDDHKKPVKDAEGSFVPDKLLAYSTMARGALWGLSVPALLRNENWNYAIFSPEGQLRTPVNHAECFACHKAVGNSSHIFTLKHLAAARYTKQ